MVSCLVPVIKAMKKTKKIITFSVIGVIAAAVLITLSAIFAFLNWNSFILKGFEADFEKAVQDEGYEILENSAVKTAVQRSSPSALK